VRHRLVPVVGGAKVTPEDHFMLEARRLAIIAHANQTDKAGNDYYRAHVADVAHRVGIDPTHRTVAYLHDVVEDTHWSLDALGHVGFSGEVLLAVDAITHRPHEPRADYYARVKANPLALAVKLADIASNSDPARLALLDEATRERLTAKYAAAIEALTDHGLERPGIATSRPRTDATGTPGAVDRLNGRTQLRGKSE
jgi:hypothetical protein